MNKGIYFASFTAVLWGFMAIALKVSLGSLPPLSVAWFRFTIAFITLFLYYLLFDRTKIKIIVKPPLFAILAAICLGFNYLGYISGIHLTTASIGQVFIQAGPMLLAVSGFLFFKEKVSLRQAIGLGVVSVGMLVFYNEQIVNLASGLNNYKTGVILVLLGALAWVGYALFQKVAVRSYNPMQLNLILFGLPSLLLTPFVAFDKFPLQTPTNWMLLVFLGFNTLGAYGSLAYAFKYLEANKISVIITLNPLITFVVMALLGLWEVSWIKPETFSLLTVVGALTVLTGAILTVLKKERKRLPQNKYPKIKKAFPHIK